VSVKNDDVTTGQPTEFMGVSVTDAEILDWLESITPDEDPMFALSTNPSSGKFRLELNSFSREFYGASLRECCCRAMAWQHNAPEDDEGLRTVPT
jgi:hypothetical protein